MSRFDASDPKLLPDAFFLNNQGHNAAAAAIGLRQTVMVSPGAARSMKSPLIDIGSQALAWNGIPIYRETLLPANAAYTSSAHPTGYLLNFSQIHLSVQPTFTGDFAGIAKNLKMTSDEKTQLNQSCFEVWANTDPQRRQLAISATIPAQFAINPRYQLAFAAIS